MRLDAVYLLRKASDFSTPSTGSDWNREHTSAWKKRAKVLVLAIYSELVMVAKFEESSIAKQEQQSIPDSKAADGQ
jgi:hypothetical protein